MKHQMMRVGSALSLALVACSTEQAPSPSFETKTSDLTGITGANCDGIAGGMVDPNGVVQPAQSIIRLYNLKLRGSWTKIDGNKVLELSLPAAFEQTNQVYPEWEAKSGNLFRSRDALAYGGRDYYPGVFGFLDEVDVPEGTCSGEALDDKARDDGTLGQVAVSQAGPCGTNENGTIKFWQVNGLSLIPIGTILDVQELINAGLAVAVTSAPMDRCLTPDLNGNPGSLPPPTPGAPPVMPCRFAFATSAVTEGVVMRVPSMEVV